MNKKILSFQISITVIKLILLIAAAWMFLALLLSITDAVQINDYLFGKAGHGGSSGDYGIIITITTWFLIIGPIFVKGKLDKIFCGILLFMLGLICFIGSLVTSSSAATFLGWSIPTLTIGTVGVLWILEGTNVVKFKSQSSKSTTNKRFDIHNITENAEEVAEPNKPRIPSF